MNETPPDETPDRDIGQGYPEEEVPGSSPVQGRDRSGGDTTTGAPDTGAPQDSDPGKATGNPGAAGSREP
jgi:hypothetical protein